MKPSTPRIVLDEHLTTGLTDVDAQHHRLFGIIQHLDTLYTNGATQEQFFATLNELQQYIIFHWETEERLINSHPVNPIRREQHIQAHRESLEHIQRAFAMATAHPETAVNLLLAYLAQWLLHHIANMDRSMAAEILALQSGQTPEQIASQFSVSEDTLGTNITAVYRNLGDHTLQLLELNVKLQSEVEQRRQTEQHLLEKKRRFRTVADYTYSWEYWQGTDGEIIYMSPSCERISGYSPDDFTADPKLLYRIIHPEDQQIMQAHEESLSLAEEEQENELGFRIIRRDGDVRCILHTCRLMYDAQGQFIGRRGSNRDVTNHQSRSDFMLLVASVFDAVNEAVVLTDENNHIMLTNASFTQITGYQSEEVLGKSPSVLEAAKPLPEFVRDLWETHTAKVRWETETTHQRKNGENYEASTTVDSVRDETGHITNFLLVFSDVNEQKANERQLHYLAHYDQLTGLPNWVLFNDRLQQALAATKRRKQLIALMCVDIDHFKSTKDRIGHEASELLLKEVARRIGRCIREFDTAARIGNDEFVVLLRRFAALPVVSGISEEILKATQEPFILNGENIHFSVSIGIAVYPEHGSNSEQLMRNADLAAYEAKLAGGSVAMLYHSLSDWPQQLSLL